MGWVSLRMDTMSDVTPNPSAIPADTSVEVWKMEMAGRRAMSHEQRMSRLMEFHDRCRIMHDEAICHRFPDISEVDFKVERARRRHGDAIAGIVKEQLLARQQ